MPFLITLLLGSAVALSDTYTTLLQTHIREDGRVNYTTLKASAHTQALMKELAHAQIPTEKNEKMAFWINAYNLITLHLVSSEFPVKSIQDLDGGKVWTKREFTVGEQLFTLDAIEHKILRPMGDPRIHAAINCASISCPPLWNHPYEDHKLDAQLDSAMNRWIKTNGYRIQDGHLEISQVFIWFSDDFSAPNGIQYPAYPAESWGALYWLQRSANDAKLNLAIETGTPIRPWPYDWALNSQ